MDMKFKDIKGSERIPTDSKTKGVLQPKKEKSDSQKYFSTVTQEDIEEIF